VNHQVIINSIVHRRSKNPHRWTMFTSSLPTEQISIWLGRGDGMYYTEEREYGELIQKCLIPSFTPNVSPQFIYFHLSGFLFCAILILQ